MCNIQYISIYLYIFYISEYSLHLFTCFNIIIFTEMSFIFNPIFKYLGFKYLNI